MNKLVVIRVGEPNLWHISAPLGRWSSPESQIQTVRNLFVEGYNVIALFVARGDIPLGAARIIGVRERIIDDVVFPVSTDLGDLRTFIEFYPQSVMYMSPTFTVTHFESINYIKYKIGSQILIPPNFAREFINYFILMSNPVNIPLNNTFIIPQNVNYII